MANGTRAWPLAVLTPFFRITRGSMYVFSVNSKYLSSVRQYGITYRDSPPRGLWFPSCCTSEVWVEQLLTVSLHAQAQSPLTRYYYSRSDESMARINGLTGAERSKQTSAGATQFKAKI